jgi:hypothetical protein
MSQAPNISIISHFYNAHSCVNEQIAHWQQINPQLNELFEFILVDDFSDTDYVLPKTDLNIRLFRITDDIPWNQGGARNLATFHARGEVALFIDIDQHIKIDFLERICSAATNIKRNTIHFFKSNPPLVNIQNGQELNHHPNSFVVNLKDFKTHVHYDEDFAGHYGYEDIFLMRAWEKAGGKLTLINEDVSHNLSYGTSNLDRDVQRNQALIQKKVFEENCKISPAMLRFSWKEVLAAE